MFSKQYSQGVSHGWLLALLLVVGGCASSAPALDDSELDSGIDDEDKDATAPDDELPDPVDPSLPIPAAIETLLIASEIRAGEEVRASCAIFDAEGNELDPGDYQATLNFAPSYRFERRTDGTLIAIAAGEGEVSCSLPLYGLFDESPKPLTILPGEANSVITRLSMNETVAGDSVDVECLAFDAFGNALEDFEATLSHSPVDEGTSLEDFSFSATRSGTYELGCIVPGASISENASLVVRPALPAQIALAKSPERALYKIGDQLTLLTDVRDRFGNRVIAADIAFEGNPGLTNSGPRFSFVTDGTFTITATVTSDTDEGLPVTASLQVISNSSGPSIECVRASDRVTPSDAYMANLAPGSSIRIPVRVSDASNIDSVTINGIPAALADDGLYEVDHRVTWGMNFFDIVAKDEYGAENVATCVILASDTWADEPTELSPGFMAGALALRLNQQAIDDGTNDGKIESLNDLVQPLLAGPTLTSMMEGPLVDANPLYDECVQGGPFGTCLVRARINYSTGNLNIQGPNQTELTLVDGGLEMDISVRNFNATFGVDGTCGSGRSVTLDIGSILAGVTFDLRVEGGALRASVRQGAEPTIETNGLSVSCKLGTICNVACSLLRGTIEGEIRNALVSQLRSFIDNNLGPMLDDALAGFDLSSLGMTFELDKLDGSGTVELSLGARLGGINVTPQRLLLPIDARFTISEAAHARESLGIARRAGTILLDPPGTSNNQPLGLTFYEGALNQLLHGLWRAGYFHGAIAMGGGQANIDARLPVVAHIEGSKLKLMLGGIDAEVAIPGIIDTPIGASFGGVATAEVMMHNGELGFGQLEVEELFIGFNAPLSAAQRDVLQDFLGGILESVLLDGISDSLPTIPVPSFSLPGETFGFDEDIDLGILNPSLSVAGQHFRLVGGFGNR